ncbi:TPA: hypothetical protein EYO57_19585 [Candidatus Poribacteria bacterium]|nr:hypothetical protein [Candidatus Poribacteria bacterium]HIC16638.1 hypothetical protein [Candidatus Poribacteria bacterium]HIN27626.1 hypothetical protein [Candidatus Poribacteria bacterium]HIO49395.1 hypothetical protein [Candidatus Poribacteria bacterium]
MNFILVSTPFNHMMAVKKSTTVWLILLLMLMVDSASAWWTGGHVILSKAAVRALPDDVPDFFRSSGFMIAHCSADPDIANNRDVPHLRSAQHPDHYLDLELLKGNNLPDTRYGLINLCHQLKLDPEKVGFLPYEIIESTERLALSFAEYRRYPKNPYIQQKCLVYAGLLGHYSEDVCQPLHVTLHHNGRVNADGEVIAHKGIHYQVDAIIEHVGFTSDQLTEDLQIQALDDLRKGVLAIVQTKHSEVERLYELADQFPSENEADPTLSPEVAKFVKHMAVSSTQFTAQLYLTAWQMSKDITFPGWYGKSFDRSKYDSE